VYFAAGARVLWVAERIPGLTMTRAGSGAPVLLQHNGARLEVYPAAIISVLL
jgi:hypothetical protein